MHQFRQAIADVVAHRGGAGRRVGFAEEREQAGRYVAFRQARAQRDPFGWRIAHRHLGDHRVEHDRAALADDAAGFDFRVAGGDLQVHLAPARTLDEGQLQFKEQRLALLLALAQADLAAA